MPRGLAYRAMTGDVMDEELEKAHDEEEDEEEDDSFIYEAYGYDCEDDFE